MTKSVFDQLKLTITISGHTASGKSTLAFVIARFLRKELGCCRVTLVDDFGKGEKRLKPPEQVKMLQQRDIEIRTVRIQRLALKREP